MAAKSIVDHCLEVVVNDSKVQFPYDCIVNGLFFVILLQHIKYRFHWSDTFQLPNKVCVPEKRKYNFLCIFRISNCSFRWQAVVTLTLLTIRTSDVIFTALLYTRLNFRSNKLLEGVLLRGYLEPFSPLYSSFTDGLGCR